VLTMRHPLSTEVSTNFADKWQLLGWYSLLADLSNKFVVVVVVVVVLLLLIIIIITLQMLTLYSAVG
jgi:hypothetical protein